jgi:hypothetical protein
MKKFRLVRGLSTTCVLTLYILSRALPAAAITSTAVQYDPVPDPRAAVIVGSDRFTILTPKFIRMEWASDRKFEDHASLVFLNGRLAFQRLRPRSGPTEGW